MAVRAKAGSEKALSAERGIFVIADIAGYTGYVVESPLEHAEDVLTDVTALVVEHLGKALSLNKQEGDAIFGYALEGSLDGAMLLDTIEECYFSFRNRLVGIERATSCDCNACAKLPELDLKFVVHAGEFIRRPVVGGEELTGAAVIVAHRLLKNDVEEKGYALLTAAAVAGLGLVPVRLGLREHVEEYEDVGQVPGWVTDLEARWEAELARRRTVVGAREAELELELHLPVAPPAAWELLTAPGKRALWQGQVEEQADGGRRGPGTTSFCVDGRTTIYEEILDWRPFRYFTETRTLPGGKAVLTTELDEMDGGTRVRVRAKAAGERSRLTGFATARARRKQLERGYARLSELVDEES
ncbi:MAG TPA: DUF2652 domain-containing protein [Gaiellaceae bacterium]|nr:DUF2652 domain-containing protein [Gaiellaceae bacterium]